MALQQLGFARETEYSEYQTECELLVTKHQAICELQDLGIKFNSRAVFQQRLPASIKNLVQNF